MCSSKGSRFLLCLNEPAICACMLSHFSHGQLFMAFSVRGTLQARTLERVAMSSSRGSSQPRDQTPVSYEQADSLPLAPPGKSIILFSSPFYSVYIFQKGNIETKLISIMTNSTEFNGNNGQPFPSAGDLPNPGIKPWSPALQADSLPLSHQFSSVQFSHSVTSNSLRPREPQHARSPYLSPTPGVHPNPCPSSQ